MRGAFGEKKILGKKVSQCRKNERVPFGVFSTSILSQTIKKLKWGKFPKRFPVLKKIEKGDPSVSPGMVCYAEKQEKSFWFSLLGQMVQKFFVELLRTIFYFGQFVWIKKKKTHYNSRVSLHEAPTKNEDVIGIVAAEFEIFWFQLWVDF